MMLAYGHPINFGLASHFLFLFFLKIYTWMLSSVCLQSNSMGLMEFIGRYLDQSGFQQDIDEHVEEMFLGIFLISEVQDSLSLSEFGSKINLNLLLQTYSLESQVCSYFPPLILSFLTSTTEPLCTYSFRKARRNCYQISAECWTSLGCCLLILKKMGARHRLL